MELLCIQTHSKGVVIAGNTYPFIQDSDNSPYACGCKKDCVDVGVKGSPFVCADTGEGVPFGTTGVCYVCEKKFITSDIWWIRKILFATIATEEEVERLKQEKELTKTI